MRIGAKGEYAAKAVLYLSLQYPKVVTIHEIAHNHKKPLKYLEQILLALKRADLLESHRGVRGGYTLGRRPDRISIGEVLRVVDGKFSQSSCVELDLQRHHTGPEENSCGLKCGKTCRRRSRKFFSRRLTTCEHVRSQESGAKAITSLLKSTSLPPVWKQTQKMEQRSFLRNTFSLLQSSATW